jgi:hypothetical protein
VWSLLCPFRKAGRKLRAGKVGPLLKLDARTVRKAVYRLRDPDLLNGMTPIIPDQSLALFRDRAHMQHFLTGAASEMLESSAERRVVSPPCNTASRAGPKKSSDAAGEYTLGTVTPKHALAFPSMIGHRGGSPLAGRCRPVFITLLERPST